MGTTADNALTEVALALAMAFFALLVLALVSVGQPKSGPEFEQSTDKSYTEFDTLALALRANEESSHADDAPTFIAFLNGKFYNQDALPVAPHQVNGKQILLAVDPDVSMSASLSAKGQFQNQQVLVTTLTTQWIDRLIDGQ